jgi:hypothetical protein
MVLAGIIGAGKNSISGNIMLRRVGAQNDPELSPMSDRL